MPRRAHEAPATKCAECAEGRPRTAEWSGSRCTKTKSRRILQMGARTDLRTPARVCNKLTKQANKAVQSIFSARKSMESHLFLM